jgi:hypothetical protein
MACARLGLEGAAYAPIAYGPAITAPVLYLAAAQDELCPLHDIQAAAKATPHARLVSTSGTHWDAYAGKALESSIQHMVAFLRETNGVAAAAAAAGGGGSEAQQQQQQQAEAAATAAGSAAEL